MDDPFSNKAVHADGFVDKIVDALLYQRTNAQYKKFSLNEPYLILPVVKYIDKTDTNVSQRNELEPFHLVY